MASEAKPLDAALAAPVAEGPADKPTATETPTVPEIVEPHAGPTPAAGSQDLPTSTEEPAALNESLTQTPAEAVAAAAPKSEPITEGLLAYKAPAKFPMNLIPGRDHKYFFWFGDEAVPAEKLSSFTNSTKHHEAAAWSSQTGKGLLYYAKDAESKDTPAGVLPLSEVTHIKEIGGTEFTFKIAEHKHVFNANTASEREGWVQSLKAEVESAAGKKDEIHGSDGFKKTLEGFAPAAAVAGATHHKKSAEAERTTREEKNTKENVKSRSVSRGKGIFDRFNKKETAHKDETAAVPAETTAPITTEIPAASAVEPVAVAAPAETTETTETPVAASTEAAPVIAAATTTDETKSETVAEETGKAERPTPVNTRRSSRLGDFFKKVTSPTTEKKETEVAPVVGETSAVETTPAGAEPVAAVPAVDSTTAATEAPVVGEGAATTEGVTPGREKKKFMLPNLFEKKANKDSAASTDHADARAVAEHAIAGDVVTEPATVEPAATTPTLASPVDKSEKRRSSFFGSDFAGSIKKLGGKKEKSVTPAEGATATETAVPVAAEETPAAITPAAGTATAPTVNEPAVAAPEHSTINDDATETKKEKEDIKSKVSNLGRRISVAMRGSKDRKASPAPPTKVAEEETSAISSAAPQIDEPKTVSEPSALSSSQTPAVIGDVIPEAVTASSEPMAANRTVSATA